MAHELIRNTLKQTRGKIAVTAEGSVPKQAGPVHASAISLKDLGPCRQRRQQSRAHPSLAKGKEKSGTLKDSSGGVTDAPEADPSHHGAMENTRSGRARSSGEPTTHPSDDGALQGQHRDQS